jgi:hypothetical protein
MIAGIKNKILQPADEATQLLKSMLLDINSIVELIEKENKLIEQRQLSSLAPIIEKKIQITEGLDNKTISLKAMGVDFKDQEYKKILSKIEASYLKFNEVNYINAVLLKSSMEVSKMIIDMQKRNQVNKTVEQFGYNKDGKNSAMTNLEKVVPSMSLNSKV